MDQAFLDILVAIALLIAAIGIIVPILPGTLLAIGALLFWAALTGGNVAWIVFGIGAVLMGLGQVLKYMIPHKSLTAAGIPTRSIIIGYVVAVVGFFVVPVFGLPLGFVAGVLVSEFFRKRTLSDAWESTWLAMKATGFSIMIELAALMLATTFWVSGVAYYAR